MINRNFFGEFRVVGVFRHLFLSRFFHGSAEQLVLGLVDARQLAPDDLRAIEAKLAALTEGASPKGGRRKP